MKKLLLAGAALAAIAFAPAAQAADVSSPVTYDWTGFYLGANAGVAWNNSNIDNDFYLDGLRYNNIENKIESDQTVFTAGGLIGYNYQINQVVLGAEADINYLGFGDDNTRKASFTDGPDTVDLESKGSFEADWFGTVRGRLGFAIDNVLLYGTGGLAYGHMNADGKLKMTVNDTDTYKWDGSTDSTNWGWTVGAGAEYGIGNWSLGVEYLYVDLGSAEWSGNWANDYDGGRSNLKGSVDYAFSTVRATAKVRF